MDFTVGHIALEMIGVSYVFPPVAKTHELMVKNNSEHLK